MNVIDSPIFVTGIERSGSSIIARILQMCGAYTGRTSEMMENDQVKNLVDKYYSDLHVDKNGRYPLPDTKELLIPVNWAKEVKLRIQLYSDVTWLYKSSRIAQVWPVWSCAFPNAKYVIVRRRTGDIISSCMKTAYMDTFKLKVNQKAVGADSENDGWLWWVHQHEKLFIEMIESGLNCKVIWPERMVYGDYCQIHELLKWVGLSWNSNVVALAESLLQNSPQRKKGE